MQDVHSTLFIPFDENGNIKRKGIHKIDWQHKKGIENGRPGVYSSSSGYDLYE